MSTSAQVQQTERPEVFRAQLVATLPHLRAFARGLTGRADLTDDLVQDTAIRAWSARDRYEAGTNFKAWCFTILRNIYFNSLRRNRFHADYDPEVAERTLVERAQQEDALHLDDLERALLRLPSDRREALLLVGASGLSYEEAARVCDVPLGTMKSRVARARSQLNDMLAELHAEPDEG